MINRMQQEKKSLRRRTLFLKGSYFVLPVPALHSFMVPSSRESDLQTVKGSWFSFLCGRCDGDPFVYHATHHRVKWYYCLWHEEVEDVIKMFSEKEPFGVDVCSHLQNNTETGGGWSEPPVLYTVKALCKPYSHSVIVTSLLYTLGLQARTNKVSSVKIITVMIQIQLYHLLHPDALHSMLPSLWNCNNGECCKMYHL